LKNKYDDGFQAGNAHNHQKVPEGFYNTEAMLGKVILQAGKVSAYHSCMEARGMRDARI
jgi:sulfur relay (sulfurtransferase) complex TusBCD TusD component (DsrE family)